MISVAILGLIVVAGLVVVMIALNVKGELADYAALSVLMTSTILLILSAVCRGYYTVVSFRTGCR